MPPTLYVLFVFLFDSCLVGQGLSKFDDKGVARHATRRWLVADRARVWVRDGSAGVERSAFVSRRIARTGQRINVVEGGGGRWRGWRQPAARTHVCACMNMCIVPERWSMGGRISGGGRRKMVAAERSTESSWDGVAQEAREGWRTGHINGPRPKRGTIHPARREGPRGSMAGGGRIMEEGRHTMVSPGLRECN